MKLKCSICRKEKEHTEFYREKRNSIKGYRSDCKECCKKRTEKINNSVSIESKICSSCKNLLPYYKFNKNKRSKDGLSCGCKQCISINNKVNYNKYYKTAQEYLRNSENKKRKQEKANIRDKERRIFDYNFRIRKNLRCRIRSALKLNRKVDSTFKLVGCNLEQLKQYLESKFLPGMTWSNYGKNGWEVDHIYPCSKFDLTKEEEQRKCFHYTNLQPLWALDNWKKGNKIYVDSSLHNLMVEISSPCKLDN
jgi:hypothetical protein